MNVGIAFGGLSTLLLYQLRNQAVEKQTKTQYETFNQDKQFSNYLEASVVEFSPVNSFVASK